MTSVQQDLCHHRGFAASVDSMCMGPEETEYSTTRVHAQSWAKWDQAKNQVTREVWDEVS